jgi:hypothetical protein
MPDGKPSGVRCVQLTNDLKCALFGMPERPAICVRFAPGTEMCGTSAEQALAYLSKMELLTSPKGN